MQVVKILVGHEPLRFGEPKPRKFEIIEFQNTNRSHRSWLHLLRLWLFELAEVEDEVKDTEMVIRTLRFSDDMDKLNRIDGETEHDHLLSCLQTTGVQPQGAGMKQHVS